MLIRPRRRLRLSSFDYREAGWYFVTICTEDRKHSFGEIVDGELVPTALGSLVDACWRDLPAHHPHVVLDAYVVMPNHLHGLLEVPERTTVLPATSPVAPGALGAVVRSFKSAVTRRFRQLHPGSAATIWQKNYYEHVVRDHDSVERIRWYIASNEERWHLDAENRLRTGFDPFESWLDRQGDRPVKAKS